MRQQIIFQKKKKIRRKFCFAEEIDKHLKELEKKQFNKTRKIREKTLHQKIKKS